MRPDHLINKSGSQNHGYLQNSSYRTNRYLTITNSSSTSASNAASGSDSAFPSTQNHSKDAKSFHKSLRKAPKGIYLNYDELTELAQNDNKYIFEQLNLRINFLKKQVKSQIVHPGSDRRNLKIFK
jgi:hypothetical protein